MHIEKIHVAQNGFVLEDSFGRMHIAPTLHDAADVAGEFPRPSVNTFVQYVPGFGANDLKSVNRYFRAGRKIDAIKLLRDCFTPRLGLREAKNLVEQLCG
jgi:ribosomal protein L7/L12